MQRGVVLKCAYSQVSTADRARLMVTSGHLSPKLTSSYLQGRTSPGEVFAVEAHLLYCDDCRRRLRVQAATPTAIAPANAKLLKAVFGLGEALATGARPPLRSRSGAWPWRRAAKGVWTSELNRVAGLGEAVRLILVQAGAPFTPPAGTRLVVVIRGAPVGDERGKPAAIIETPDPRSAPTLVARDTDRLYLAVGDGES